MIKDNQKNFSRLHVVIDACVITISYFCAWALRFIGPFAASAVRARSFEQYMSALIEKLRSCAKENPDFLTNLTLKLGDAFQTDYTVSQLQALSELLLDCQVEPFVTLTGETRKGEEFMEFYVDEAALAQTVQDIFYQ